MERWTRWGLRYAVPVSATTAATFGAAFAAQTPGPLSVVVGVAAVASGGVTVATCLALLRARPQAVPPRAAVPTRPRPAILPADRRERSISRAPTPLDPLPVAAGFARSTNWDTSLTPSSAAAEVLWHEWLPNGTGVLEVPLVAPVPETYYQPPNPAAVDPFPAKEPDLVLVGPWAPLALSASAASTGADDWAGGSFGVPIEAMSPVEIEALSPLPPHLRTGGITPTKRRQLWVGPPASPTVASVPESCTTCAVGDLGPRAAPCPACAAPICGDCVTDSLLAHGAMWCADCLPRAGVPAAG